MTAVSRLASCLLVSLATLTVAAQAADDQARVWAASCAACHGTQGRSAGGIPSIAGLDQALLREKLLAFRQGTLPSTVMHQHAKGYTDQELERVAFFFSQQAPADAKTLP